MKAAKLKFAKIETREATLDEIVRFFRKKSSEVDPDKVGVNIVLVPSEETRSARVDLDLLNVSAADAVKYAALVAGAEVSDDGETLIIAKKHCFPASGLPPTDTMKAAKLIFPRIALHEASLDEAVAFIRKKSVEIDPDRSGVEIIVAPSARARMVERLDLANVSAARRREVFGNRSGSQVLERGRGSFIEGGGVDRSQLFRPRVAASALRLPEPSSNPRRRRSTRSADQSRIIRRALRKLPKTGACLPYSVSHGASPSSSSASG